MRERGGGEVSRYSVENYLSDSAGKFRGWGESFSVSFFPGIDKVWIRGGGGSIKVFSPVFFVSRCRGTS